MKILICDEEEKYINKWNEKIQKTMNIQNMVIDMYTSAHEVKQENYDIALIDTIINDVSGFDLAKQLYKNNKKCLIIFISNHTEHVSKAFETRAFQFLFKDMDDELFSQELKRAYQEFKRDHARCILYTDKQSHIFLPNEIMYIESKNRKIKMETVLGNYEGYVNDIVKLKNNLIDYGFYQVHQSFFVNLNYIHSIKKGEIELQGGEIIPTSILNRKVIKEKINNFLMYP